MVTFASSQQPSLLVRRDQSIYKSAFTRPHVISEPSVNILRPGRLSRLASTFTSHFAHHSLCLSFKALCSISVLGKEKKKSRGKSESWTNSQATESLQFYQQFFSSSNIWPVSRRQGSAALWSPPCEQLDSSSRRPFGIVQNYLSG